LYTKLYAGKGGNGFMKYTVSFHVEKSTGKKCNVTGVARTRTHSTHPRATPFQYSQSYRLPNFISLFL
jgi:hypothetical protein